MNPSISITLILFVTLLHISCNLAQDSSSEPQRRGSHHRHRHHHHGNNNNHLSSDSGQEDNEFIAAFLATEAPPEPELDEDDEEDVDAMSRSSLESRLENLEDDVRHLCLEDEEDVQRRIRVLGVKCICPKTEAPVCGSDNVTYYNRCYLHCRAQQAENSYHRYKITLKKFGRC